MTTTCVKKNKMTLTVSNNIIKPIVKTYSMSKKYMITMLQVSVLNIMYHRLYVDEDEFVKKSFNNIDFKSFRHKSKNILIRQYHTFSIAAKEALDKGYLREFYLFFVDGATDDIVENYKFSFKYAKDDARVQFYSQDLIKTTCDLLKTLNDLANHDKLNPGVQVKAELTYFDYTPWDYQPPLFVAVKDSDSLKSKLGKKGNSVMLGSVCTGFHCLKCRARGKVFNFNDSTTDSEVTEKENKNPRYLTPRSSKQVANDKLKIVKLTEEPDEGPPKKRFKSSKLEDKLMIEDLTETLDKTSRKRSFGSKNRLKYRILSDSSISSTELSVMDKNTDLESGDEEILPINCPCKLPVVESCFLDLIKCSMCKDTYHAACVGYLDKSFVEDSFTCYKCGTPDRIMERSPAKICKIRCVLGIVYKYGKIHNFAIRYANIFTTLESLEILRREGNQWICDSNVIETFFNFNKKRLQKDFWFENLCED